MAGINASWSNTGQTAVPLNTWTFVSATYDGTAIKYYFNGEPDGNYPAGGTLTTSADNLLIGNRIDTKLFPGSIDETRIYNRALTASEVKQLYLLGK